MSKKRKIISLAVLGVLLLASLALSLLLGKGGAKESLQTIMRDAVLHEDNKISLFGLMDVNPAVVSGRTAGAGGAGADLCDPAIQI